MMTQQAIVIVMDWACHVDVVAQEQFSEYFAKLIAEYYEPKRIWITGRTMEAILENYDIEKGKEKATPQEVA